MSRPRPADPIGTAEEPARLLALVELLGALDLQPGDPARVVRLSDHVPAGGVGLDGGEVELGVLELEPGDHPLAFLAGFVAPPAWTALGVVCTGRARHLDGPAGQPGEPVRIAQVVARSGVWATAWTHLAPCPASAAGTGSASARGATASGGAGDAPTGRVDDALRRALGVPTPPPSAGTELLWATQWLDSVLADAVCAPARTSRRRTSLAALVAGHPAVAAFDLDPRAVTVAGLVAAGERLAALRPWAGLRHACAGGRWSHPEVPDHLAPWLDDGAFARWVLGGYPDLGQLAGALEEVLAPSAWSVVADALDGWGLGDPGAPTGP